MRPVLQCGWYFHYWNNTLLEKTDFSFAGGYQLQIASWLGVGSHVYTHILVQALHLTWPVHVSWACAAVSVSFSVCRSCCVSKTISLESGFYSLPTFSSVLLSEHWWLSWTHLGLSVPESLLLWHCLLVVSVSVFIHCKELLWWWLSKEQGIGDVIRDYFIAIFLY